MPKLQETALVLEHEEVALRTYRLSLRAPQIAKTARVGQFAMIRVREGLDPLLRRPFSFHRIHRDEGVVEHLYRVVGRGTWWLSQARPGTPMNLVGPLGNGFRLPGVVTYPVALIAGGIGIAPLMQLLVELLAKTSENRRSAVHLFYGARTSEELLSRETFQEHGISLHISTDDGSMGVPGRVTELLEHHAEKDGFEPHVVFSCGPLAMQVHVARWVLARHVSSQLSLEAVMACGVGACLGCALPVRHPIDPASDHYVHVCKDGPVFEAGSIEWNKVQPHPTPPPTFLYS